MPGTLFVVATPIGNLEDITARALRVLGEVALVAAEDTRRTHHLLARYAIATPMTSLHEHNEGRKAPSLIEKLRHGESIALVSDAGTPTVSDPGQRLVRAAIDAGVRVEPIPGPSAVITALAGSGLAGESFSFLGFPPTRSKDRKRWFEALKAVAGLAVFFEAPHRVRATLKEINDELGDRPICLARELTKIHEEFIRGTLSQVLDILKAPVGEFTVVLDVGHSTEYSASPSADAAEIADEFGRMTVSVGLTKRQAVTQLARKHGLPTNAVYDAIEKARKSVNRP